MQQEMPAEVSEPCSRMPGLNHQGVVYRDVAELADVVAPELAAALARGRTVMAIVDEQAAGQLRRRLGRDADRVVFTDPAVAFAAPPQTVVAQRRREAAELVSRGRPMTVVGQFQSWMAPADVAFWESMFNLVLAELPITLMCACPGHARVAGEIIAQTHPRLRKRNGTLANRDFREPLAVLAEHPPPAPPPLGAPTGERAFLAPHDLAPLRAAVRAHGQVAGLGPDRVEDAVLAVSEAATNCIEHGAGHGSLRLWAAGGRLVWEIHEPGRSDPAAEDAERYSPGRLGLLPPAAGDARSRGMWAVRGLSETLHVWSDGHGTSMRGSVSR